MKKREDNKETSEMISELKRYFDSGVQRIKQKYKTFRIGGYTRDKIKFERSLAGTWLNTDLDDDALWEEVMKRRSRRQDITL